VVLIVIDTCPAPSPGATRTPLRTWARSSTQAASCIRALAHILWVHHVPLEGERMRGHGALLGAMDTTLHVVKADRVRTATVVKANDSEEGANIAFTLESVTIGVDSDGTETTAPIVVPAEPATEKAPTSPKGKMSDRQRLALKALTDATLSGGKPAPADYQLPVGIQVVRGDDWREELFSRGILERAASNPRADFKRIRESLAARNLIGVRNDDVWACSRV
jgi:hypothetical protein